MEFPSFEKAQGKTIVYLFPRNKSVLNFHYFSLNQIFVQIQGIIRGL